MNFDKELDARPQLPAAYFAHQKNHWANCKAARY